MKTTLKLTILLFVAVLGISCNTKSQSQTDSISVISPTEFKEKAVNNTIIDVRTPQEFSEGHIEGAVNINFFDATFLEQISKYKKDEPVFIYCKSGNRSGQASKKISDSGFKQIYDLEGGILNWVKNNNEVIK
ncbi:rhodanese-like domain-containing protein [Lutibacter sp.]|uniref:rhodanese-like domain-containing protein n=1 Tax=Lutibacter sp. TaxID=1925666 RepID=UPI00356674E2